MSTNLVERAAGFLESRLSRRSVITRSAFAGSAIAAARLDYVLRPGSAYQAICSCGNPSCGCGSTCCQGFSEFCCTINGGYNYCPANTVMGGWWKANGSSYCNGPRYYMDCNAVCNCDTGCGNGFPFCERGCTDAQCGCGQGSCANWAVGCFQFRYGQCNQDVGCLGAILCRVVACIPPWEVDPSCTTTNAEDDGTANMNVPCNTSVPSPPPPPAPPCDSPETRCEVVGIAAVPQGAGYWMVTGFGRLFAYGPNAANPGDAANLTLTWPIVGLAPTPTGRGYWFVALDGGIFAYGDAQYYGSMGGRPISAFMAAMAATPTGRGYWTVAADGGVFAYGDAQYYGSTGGQSLNRPIVAMAATPTGRGYWLVAADGGMFAFGDAPFEGSQGGAPLTRPVVGMAAAGPGSPGYWLVAEDGGVFAFDTSFYGSPVPPPTPGVP